MITATVTDTSGNPRSRRPCDVLKHSGIVERDIGQHRSERRCGDDADDESRGDRHRDRGRENGDRRCRRRRSSNRNGFCERRCRLSEGPRHSPSAPLPRREGLPIDQVTIDFGDGDSTNLGPVSGTGITVQHIYDDHDTYRVTVTATDLSGESASASDCHRRSACGGRQPCGIEDGKQTATFTATVSPSDTVLPPTRGISEMARVQRRRRTRLATPTPCLALQCHRDSDDVDRASRLGEHDRQHST